MARGVTAGDRLRRVLAMVPWIVANPGIEVSRVAARFDLTEDEVLQDLDVVWMVGLPPYTPDALVEVTIEENKVWIHYADFFARPVRLTAGQGLALLAATEGLLSVPGTEPNGPLARALAKLARTLGVEPEVNLDVDLGAAEPGHLTALRAAAASGETAEIDYYSFGRDERTTRVIEPWRVLAAEGAWYVQAHCRLAEAERLFRLDRIEAVRPSSAPAAAPREAGPGSADSLEGSSSAPGVFHPGPDDPRVTLRLAPSARWVVETYPTESAEVADDGSIEAVLVVTARPWLERLLLQLGPAATVLDTSRDDWDAESLAAEAARRVLASYQG